MTESQKTTILAMRQKGCTFSVIAETLGLSTNSVKSFARRNENRNVCKNCGKNLPEKTTTKPRVFCCDKCKQIWWNAHRNDRVNSKTQEFTCVTCNKPFTAYKGTDRKYCSKECYRKRGVTYEQ